MGTSRTELITALEQTEPAPQRLTSARIWPLYRRGMAWTLGRTWLPFICNTLRAIWRRIRPGQVYP